MHVDSAGTARVGTHGGFIETALPNEAVSGSARPTRKRLNHRGPLSVDVSSAWYFITICAEERCGRAVSMKPPPSTPFLARAMDILDAARFRHVNGTWFLALFLVMPDHIHLIAKFPMGAAAVSSKPPSRANPAAVSSRPPYRGGMERAIADFKRWMATKFGLGFQRDFWDTRLRDEAQFAEKFAYICNNPVRKGLCQVAREWPHVIAFDGVTGEERPHR